MRPLLFFKYETGFSDLKEAEAHAITQRAILERDRFTVRRTSLYLKDGSGRMHFVRVYKRVNR